MLKIDNVGRTFGTFRALNGVRFEVRPGEVAGLLGPNGSGKTTLLRIIATYLMPDEGTVLVNGLDVRHQDFEVKNAIGYLPESNILYEAMFVKDFLTFVGRAKGLEGPRLKDRLDWCIDACELKAMLAKRCGECSRGMRQRVAFASAVINDPPVLLLDEPTAGLDPLQSHALRNVIRTLAKEKTVVFSSHIFGEVASVTDRVLILHNGSLLADTNITAATGRVEWLENLFMKTVDDSGSPAAAPERKK